MDTTGKVCGLFLLMFILTALLQFFMLRRRSNRLSILGTVLRVAVFSGIIWVTSWMMIDWGDDLVALAQDSPSFFEKMLIIGILFLVFTAMALIPAGTVALIYRKSKKDLLASEFPG
jgi:amino acid permease